MRRLSARNSLLVFLVMYLAKNVIIVSLLDLLSHVTKPICAMMSETCSFEQVLSNYLKYFMCNSKPFNNLKESTTQPFTIVCIVEPRETQQRTLDLPSPCTRSSIQ